MEKHRDALPLVGKILRQHVYCWEEVKDCVLLAANGPVKVPDDKYDGAGVFLSFFFFKFWLVKNLPVMQETWVRSLGWDDSLEKGKATHSSILAWRTLWII